MLKLSILDQVPVCSGSSEAAALEQSVRLAQLGDKLGYHRFWIAEHHGSASFACGSPEIMVARIAGATRRIRVGSGGVMLMHYSPFKVAENFLLLQTLYPGRIDLGVGRAPGGDGLCTAALGYGSRVGVEYLPAKIADLRAFVTGDTPLTEALAGAVPMPPVTPPPELWLLGSSDNGARLAAELGVHFAYAHFFNPRGASAACRLYREEFEATPEAPEARVVLAACVLCADEPAYAERLARSYELWRIRCARGENPRFLSIEESDTHAWTAAERAQAAESSAQQIVGTPADVARELKQLAEAAQADELAILSIAHRFDDRVRCYELLAREMMG